MFFQGCSNVNEYADRFTNELCSAIHAATSYRRKFICERLPKFFVHLLQAKKNAWRHARYSGDYSAYKAARRVIKAAIRQFRRSQEDRIVNSNNRQMFYSYVRNKLGSALYTIELETAGNCVGGKEAAGMLLDEFLKNFSNASTNVCQAVDLLSMKTSLWLNSAELAVVEALAACSNLSTSPDGISFKILNTVSRQIIKPLNITFQHSLHDSEFPLAWKHVVIIPLFKDHRKRSEVTAYCPISLCQCSGKVFEKLVHGQLKGYLHSNSLLHDGQNGFTKGKSTPTNLLTFDSYVSDCVIAGHSFDIIAF